ncbi:MAG: DUF4954 family protein [Bacteroidales bacterium]|jgi:hypothetical protein|nr:DUF4954 family protein [Bacteroidales bacterium]MDD2205098.1 DUF4954 family protein [Bacteroidales bacterium]MDD3152315.1 DUF4954 family protein [Bacteroidales bacterium]MDD3914580.1 DUF4954 family protein [Bacteroidales bacterium]MDD4634475.1 DUF4954 family protein [Bacteroidales bacterium]
MENKLYRKLTSTEIDELVTSNCRCEDWNKINVVDGFSAKYIRNANFSGNVFLGVFEKQYLLQGNVVKHSGISNASIHNCVIGNDVCINQIRNYIANYIIEDDVFIDNVDTILVDGETTFGNGTLVSVICETGGRDVTIYDNLSSHTAYIMAMYRDRTNVIKKLNVEISAYCDTVKSSMGIIEKSSVITGCRTIKNVKVGAYSVIDNVFKLLNGTVNSCETDPAYMGLGVIAENFIVSTGSIVSDGVLLLNCFVGQGCTLGKQYSAENSLFFANCMGFHGEACSVFAGPFTVTHHKSTLLIAGQFSFMNAGSGSNQSNHLYKLGPIHQGIMERGSKTASDSYILWPAKIGPFTVVMGRHKNNSDTSDLPFSYLIENNDESILVPGVNLRSVGTIRDVRKWPTRDKRKSSVKLDCVNYNLLSPFTIHRMYKAIELLTNLQTTSGATSQWYGYNSTKIKNSSLIKGLDFYNLGIIKFLGNSLISRIENKKIESDADLRNALKPDTEIGAGEWLDIAGLITPKSEIIKILDDIENDKLYLDNLNRRFAQIHENYYSYEWSWALAKIEVMYEKKYTDFSKNDAVDLILKWKSAVIKLDNLLYEDAKKEFNKSSHTSFGVDGNDADCEKDFMQVRGNFEDNQFVKDVKEHINRKSLLCDTVLAKLKYV